MDPGSRITGIGIVQGYGARLKHINHLAIKIPSKLDQAHKLVYFNDQFQEIINEYQPESMVIESLFTFKNVSSILKLSHVRGVAMMVAAKNGLKVEEIAPATIKKNTTGYGRATKEQVQYMVQKLLALKSPPEPLDCSDALAMAICYLNQSRILARIRK